MRARRSGLCAPKARKPPCSPGAPLCLPHPGEHVQTFLSSGAGGKRVGKRVLSTCRAPAGRGRRVAGGGGTRRRRGWRDTRGRTLRGAQSTCKLARKPHPPTHAASPPPGEASGTKTRPLPSGPGAARGSCLWEGGPAPAQWAGLLHPGWSLRGPPSPPPHPDLVHRELA